MMVHHQQLHFSKFSYKEIMFLDSTQMNVYVKLYGEI